jgi:hypothetical protein
MAGFQLAQHLVDEHAVGHLDRDLDEVLMRALHRVAGLERGHAGPAVLEKLGPRLGGAKIQVGIFLRVLPFRQAGHPSGQVDLTLPHHFLHAGMRRVRRAVDVLALEALVRRVFVRHFHDGEDFAAFAVDQRDLLLEVDAIGQFTIAGQRDRDGPEHPVFQLHADAGTAPVRLVHETVERGVGAHGQHQNVGHLPARHRDLGQPFCPGQFFGPLRLRRQQRLEAVTAMGFYEF